MKKHIITLFLLLINFNLFSQIDLVPKFWSDVDSKYYIDDYMNFTSNKKINGILEINSYDEVKNIQFINSDSGLLFMIKSLRTVIKKNSSTNVFRTSTEYVTHWTLLKNKRNLNVNELYLKTDYGKICYDLVKCNVIEYETSKYGVISNNSNWVSINSLLINANSNTRYLKLYWTTRSNFLDGKLGMGRQKDFQNIESENNTIMFSFCLSGIRNNAQPQPPMKKIVYNRVNRPFSDNSGPSYRIESANGGCDKIYNNTTLNSYKDYQISSTLGLDWFLTDKNTFSKILN